MKTITVIVLALLLVAAIISGFLFYGRYLDMKDALGVSNKELLGLNEKVAQLNEENSRFTDQITENAERMKELGNAIRLKDHALSGLDEKVGQLNEENSRLASQTAENAEGMKELGNAIRLKDQALSGLDEKVAQLNEENSRLASQITENAERMKRVENAELRISQLESAIRLKDQALSGLDGKISELEEGSEEERKIGESLRRELSSKDTMVAVLEEKLKGEKSMAKARIEELKSTYESLISQLKRELENKEMTISEYEEKLSITFVDRVLFDFGSATITPGGKGIITRVGDSLQNVQGMQIRVVGHTDNRPIRKEYLWKFPSNWELSSARAAAVVGFLQRECGLDPKSFEVVGRSFYRPVASNETDEGRAQNRRVEVIIAPQIGE